jgi:hypothetical protein
VSEQRDPAPDFPLSEAAPASESVSLQESPPVEIPAQATAGSTPDAPEEIPAPSATGTTPSAAAEIPAQSTAGSVDVAPPAPPAAEVKAPRRRGGLVVTVAVFLVILLGAGGYYWFSYRNSPARADVGDCLSGSENPDEADNIKLVDCSDARATFKVLRTIDNQAKPAASDQSACDGSLTTDTFWYGQEGKPGTILCLQKIHE